MQGYKFIFFIDSSAKKKFFKIFTLLEMEIENV